MEKSINIICGAIIKNEKEETLLLELKDSPNLEECWSIPLNIVNFKEKTEDSLIKNVNTDLGVDIQILKTIGFLDEIEENSHLHKIYFLCRIKEGAPKINNEKYKSARWFVAGEVPEYSSINDVLLPLYLLRDIHVDNYNKRVDFIRNNKKSNIKAVVFDNGGVLISGARFVSENMCKVFNIPMERLSEILKKTLPEFQKGKISHESFWKIFSEVSGLNLPSNYLDLWTIDFHKEAHVDDEMIELIKELKRKNMPIIMHSNTIPPHSDFMWRVGVFKEFDVVFNSCDMNERKPDPEFYDKLFSKLNCKPEELIYIEDNQEFMEYQRKIGLNLISFKSVKQLKLELKKYGVLN